MGIDGDRPVVGHDRGRNGRLLIYELPSLVVANFRSINWRGAIIRLAPLVLWIGVIFYLSSDQGSMSQTSRIIGPLLHWLFPTASEETILNYHFYIRKAAHVTEYGILAVFSFRAISLSGNSLWSKYRYLIPLILAAIIASIDEINQSFEPSRASSPYDVLLDISGAVAALVVMGVLLRLRREFRRA